MWPVVKKENISRKKSREGSDIRCIDREFNLTLLEWGKHVWKGIWAETKTIKKMEMLETKNMISEIKN